CRSSSRAPRVRSRAPRPATAPTAARCCARAASPRPRSTRWRAPACSSSSAGADSGTAPLGLVPAFGELLDQLGAERFEVARVAAGDQALIDHHLAVHPVGAGVLEIGLDRAV